MKAHSVTAILKSCSNTKSQMEKKKKNHVSRNIDHNRVKHIALLCYKKMLHEKQGSSKEDKKPQEGSKVVS